MSFQTVILAAGESSRMGSPKALLEIDGTPFLVRIAATARAAGSDGVIAVIGPPDGEKVKGKLPVGVAPVWNPDPSRGMLSSLQSAVNALPSRALGVLVWPVDLPMVTVETVRKILDGAPGKVIVPRHKGKGGHPVRIPAKLFGALQAIPVEKGLHGLLEAHAGAVAYLDVDDAGIVNDIDTPADHAAAKRAK